MATSYSSSYHNSSMASSSSSHKRGEDRPSFSGIEPPHGRRKVSESSRLYDVFINHRGPDCKDSLALELYESLEKLRIRAFLDSEEKELGNSFPSTIETAIFSAAVHIAIFSKGYAESPWCLAELVLMIQSKAKIIPLFYDVEPSALRHIEKGVYAHAFNQYREKSRYLEKLEEWKAALQSISFIAGEEFNSFSDCKKILSAVQKEVERKKCLYVAKYPVGLPKLVEHFEKQCIDKLVEDFESQLSINEKGGAGKANIVGIFGMGGVGKTTLSKILFNRKLSDYCRSCFLFDVREASAKSYLPSLQMKLLRDLFDEDRQGFPSVEDGKSILSDRFQRSENLNFLTVLDDIDHLDQLDALLIRDVLNKLCNSLVIVTTRDVGVLKSAGITVAYNLKGMDRVDAKELFCWHAFHQSYPSSGYEELVDLFVHVCGGLPLSLQVLGSHVHGEDRNFWELELKKVQKTLPRDIHARLKISIDMLDNEEKQIFMDVACFFIEESKKDAIRVWEGSGWSGQHALQKLKNKCLVEEIEDSNFMWRFAGLSEYSNEEKFALNEEMFILSMHDHLRDLGREMADELNRPRRLWRSHYHEEMADELSHSPRLQRSSISKRFENILTETKGRRLDSFRDPSMGFTIKYFIGESNDSKTSTNLLWLELSLRGQTLTNIPPWIPLQNLQYLRIIGGDLEILWQKGVQVAFPVKELQIFRVFMLKELTLGLLRCLEKITIYNCGQLKSVTGISDLTKLVEISIGKCHELEELSFGRHSCLEKIIIYNCRHLKSVTGISELSKLVELNIVKLGGLEELSLDRLSCLGKIRISDCLNLQIVASSHLQNLVQLSISDCEKIEELSFAQFNFLEKITICNCPYLKGVERISDLTKLVELNIRGCEKVEELSFVLLTCLRKITIFDCQMLRSLTGVSDLSKLVELSIAKCWNLEVERLCFLRQSCLEKIRISDFFNLNCVTGIFVLRKLVELQITKCPKLEELSFLQLNCLEKLKISGCRYLRSVTVSHLRKLVEFGITFCENIDELSFVQLGYLEKLEIPGCRSLKSIKVKGCEKLRMVLVDLQNVVKLHICDYPELEYLQELVGLRQFQMILLNKCPKLKQITLPRIHKKLTLQCCGELQTDALKYSIADFQISECPQIEFDESSFSRLSCLKIIEIDSCGKMPKIRGIEKLQSWKIMQLLYCSNETIRNYILRMKKLPSDFIQVIGRAVDGAESNLNTDLFCDSNSVIQIGADNTFSHHMVSAIIFCAVVVLNNSTAAKMIKDFLGRHDCNPCPKFDVSQGEWIITFVTTHQPTVESYIRNKGYLYPFENLFTGGGITQHIRVSKGYKVTLNMGQKHRTLNVLQRIVDKLYLK